MKRKLLFTLATMIALAGAQLAKADTTQLLEADGWSKITTVPSSSEMAANYYVFVDTNNDLMLGVGKGANNNTKWYSLGVYYYTSVSPTSNDILSKTWTLETNGDGVALRNLEYSALCIQTEWGAAWKFNTNDVANPNGWAKYNLAYADGSWTIQGGQYPESGYVGPWNDGNFANGAECAGNKTGDNVGHFQIYAINRETFKANLMAAASATNPVDVTPWYVTNATFDLGNRDGWTQTGSGGNNNTSYGGGCEIWHRSNFNLYQTITVPAGMYKVSIQASGSTSGTVYGTSGSNTVTASASVANDGNYQNNCLLMIQDRNHARITTDELAVANGSLTIGFKDETTDQWNVFDNFKVYYTGPITDLTPYIDAWIAALTAARTTAATNEKIANWVLSNLNTAISENDEEHVDQTSQAELEAATAALIAANELGQKSIHSYAVIAQGFVPDNSLEGWVCTNSNTFHINTWSNEGNSDGSNMVTPFIENWTGAGSLLGAGKVYYRLEGLEPGEVYRVEALVRSYNEASADAPNGPNFYVNGDVADLTEVGKTFTYNNMSGIYGTQVAAATIGSDGVLELGVIIAAERNYNWVAFKNIKISTFDAALEAAIAKVTACEGQVPAAVYNTAYAVVEAYTGNNYPTTADGFMTAIADIEQAAADLAPAVEAYAAYLELKGYADALVAVGNDNAEANSELATAISTAVENIAAATNVAEETEVNNTLRTAMNTYAADANPVGDDSKFDLTFMIETPDLTGMGTGGPAPGWFTEQEGVNSQKIDDGRATAEGSDKTSFFECWSWTAKANDLFTLYTPVTLPEGTYTMSCYAFARQQDGETDNDPIVGVYFYANDTQGSSVSNPYLELKEVSFVNSEMQEVKIGLKAVSTGNTYNWMGIGYVQLFKVPAQVYAIGGDEWDPATEGAGDVAIDRSINVGYNAYILPFNMTQAEVEEAFGEGSTVKVVRAFDAENEILKFSTREGIAANEPCIVKATAAHAAGEVVVPGRTLVPAAASEIVYTGEGLTMTGCYAEETNVPLYSLFVQNAKLVYNESNAFIYSTRTYITLEGWTPGENGIKGLTIIDDDEATGIAVVENGQLNLLTGKVYDLSGRAVKNPTKGLYIIDGKKVMLK